VADEIPQEQGINRESVGYGRPPAQTRFQPGRSGNPGGRPRGGTLTPILRAKLADPHPKHPDKTWAEVIVEQAMEQAALGEFRQFKEILDRIDGPVLKAAPEGDEDEPLTVNIRRPDSPPPADADAQP
jgi:hypothetical protein